MTIIEFGAILQKPMEFKKLLKHETVVDNV